jgi:hypothetical protein
VNLSPRKIAKAERDAANYETADDDRFATDEEVRAVFARLTDKGRRRAVFT